MNCQHQVLWIIQINRDIIAREICCSLIYTTQSKYDEPIFLLP